MANDIVELNNKTLSLEKAIKEWYVVEIFYFDSVSDKTHKHSEIYNIGKLNNFLKNIKEDNKDKVRIVEYSRNKTGTWVNKLFDLEYDGSKIADTEYDTYSNPNAFIPSQKIYFDFMEKRDYTDDLWYGVGTGHTNSKACCSQFSFLLLMFHKNLTSNLLYSVLNLAGIESTPILLPSNIKFDDSLAVLLFPS